MKPMLRQTTLSLALAASFTAAFTWSTDSHACVQDAYIGSVCYMAGNYCPDGYLKADGALVTINQYQALYAVIGTTYGGDARTNFNLPDLRGRAVISWGSATPQTSAVDFGAKRGTETVTLAANQVPLPQHTHPATFTATTGQQQITIPSTTGANLTLPGNLGAVPAQAAGTGNNFTPAAGSTYRLAGAKGAGTSAITGPYSTDALPATPALVSGVSVDASAMTPNIPAKNVNITTVTGGAVAVGAAGAPATVPVSLISPQQALTACIAVNGIFPTRP